MIYNIFTDPHLGTKRAMHTTPESSKRLSTALFEAAMKAKTAEYKNIIVGDLFDKTTNTEQVIVQGLLVAENAIVLAGNHDETNREGTISSLDVIAEAGGSHIIQCEVVGRPSYQIRGEMVFVPHHASQELFLEALDLALAEDVEGKVLFVHCNRGELPQQDDSTLVISLELEDRLLTKFKRVFYGHIHGSHSNETKDDEVVSRGVVLGNTHPTSFGDISDKYRYTYDLKTDTLIRHKIWCKATRFTQLALGSELPEGSFDFVEIIGNGTRQEVSDYLQQVWAAYPEAYAIRNNCEFAHAEDVMVEDVNLEDLPSTIERDLAGTDMLPLFKEIRNKICS